MGKEQKRFLPQTTSFPLGASMGDEMRRIYVALDAEVFVRLLVRAERQRRRPQDEAAVLLTQALLSGSLPDGTSRAQGVGRGEAAVD